MGHELLIDKTGVQSCELPDRIKIGADQSIGWILTTDYGRDVSDTIRPRHFAGVVQTQTCHDCSGVRRIIKPIVAFSTINGSMDATVNGEHKRIEFRPALKVLEVAEFDSIESHATFD